MHQGRGLGKRLLAGQARAGQNSLERLEGDRVQARGLGQECSSTLESGRLGRVTAQLGQLKLDELGPFVNPGPLGDTEQVPGGTDCV